MSTTTTHVCSGCSTWNTISKQSIKEIDARDEKGKQYHLLAYKCKACGMLNIVQIDDEETLMILSRVRSRASRMAEKMKNGKKIIKSEIRQAEILDRRLDKKRKELQDNVKMEFLLDENNEKIL